MVGYNGKLCRWAQELKACIEFSLFEMNLRFIFICYLLLLVNPSFELYPNGLNAGSPG